MEDTQNLKNSDCGCNDSACCTPPKKKCWQKILLVVIIMAAIGIAIWKLYFNDNSCNKNTPGCCPKDSTEVVQNDTLSPTHSCCPKKIE